MRRTRWPLILISSASPPGGPSTSAAPARSPTRTEKAPMLRIPCPWCGERDESEFHYRGDASKVRPAADAGVAAFASYVYERDNRCGWHVEWGRRVGGCRKLLQGRRPTPR